MKFLHSSDFHISTSFESSSFSRELAVERRIDIWKSIEKLINEAKNKRVDALFLSGDLFIEEYITMAEIKRLYDLFKQISSTNIFIILGNHDPYRENSKLKLIEKPENVYLFEKDYITRFEFADYDVYGISYVDEVLNNGNLFEGVELNFNKKNILMLHSDIINPSFRYQPVKIRDIEKMRFDYVALGHIHKPEVIRDNIVYSGSIEPLNFGEQGTHGAVYGNLDDDKNLNIQFLDLSQAIFIEEEYNVSGEFDFYDLKNKLLNEWIYKDKKNFLRVKLTGHIPEQYEIDLPAILEELNEYVTHLEIVNDLDFNIDLDKLYKLNQNNIIGIFIENMRKKDLTDPINKEALDMGLRALLKGN
ncbi:metallophosphoesterase family protein [Miniphocaeibacter massiliensis]|uniref:metallophosphoesterase family protein n=1 Tax=Miniphocaeibacter massiliensis TaxID=2041841 RepID=UPI000C087D9E|nr:DNA repair exonuclease [Miniphocaeibacter massiliensis]